MPMRLPGPMPRLQPACLALLMTLPTSLTAFAQASDASKPVYRCPGPPVLYTDALSPTEAKARDCRTIEGAPITIVQGPRRAAAGAGAGSSGAAAAPNAAATAAAAAARPADQKVDPAAQRARDTDSRRILEGELRKEEESLASLKREFNNGEPERRGDERNFAKYQERVAEMRASITRKEADIAAIKRELAKLPS
jgi:hypothetical protein